MTTEQKRAEAARLRSRFDLLMRHYQNEVSERVKIDLLETAKTAMRYAKELELQVESEEWVADAVAEWAA
jgi:hypothetical protein